jgi:beta-lactam-binding protein with PASTA domain/tRNA A-37 threonylcarbamoyl transferase component Bud32
VAVPRSVELVGRVLGGRYRLLRPVGTGASAHVYVAEDTRLRRRVAVKVLHPALAEDQSFLRRFRAEARSIASLRHASICRVYDWGEDEGDPYLVMELLEGGSLRSLLDTGYRLGVNQAAALTVDAASALQYAHSRGLVHRDIKPANLLFDEEGHVSIADFGIARALAEATWTEPMGAIVGTARYAAPEQLKGMALDGRADVYALALVVVEAVTGTVPFALDTTLGTLMARVANPISVPAELGRLRPVLEKAATTEPDERLDAHGFADAVAAVTKHLPVPEPLPVKSLISGSLASLDGVVEPTELAGGRRRPAGPGLTILADDLIVGVPSSPEVPSASGRVPAAGDDAAVTGTGASASLGDPSLSPDLSAPWAFSTSATGVAGTDPGVPTGSGGRRFTRAGANGVAGFGGDAPVDSGREAASEEDVDAGSGSRTGRRWAVRLGLVVAVLVVLAAAGVAAALVLLQPAPTYAVPALKGRTEAQARSLLANQHLRLLIVGEQWDPEPKGEVVDQSPSPDTKLPAKGTVSVTLSEGPQPVPVPSLATLTVAQAERVLRSAGLVLGPVTRHTSMTVPKGVLISWSFAGRSVVPGTAIGMVVSAGKPTATVPSYEARATSYTEMRTLLAGAGFKVGETTTYSDTVPSGDVVAVSPLPGTSLVVGTTVTVTVSLGPHMVVVPQSIVGMSVDQAANELYTVGLGVYGVQGNLRAPVTGSQPAVGTPVRYGSSVILVTG